MGFRLTAKSTLLMLLGDEIEAAWRLGHTVTLHQQSQGWAEPRLQAGGPPVLGVGLGRAVHCIRLWAIVPGCAPVELGVYEAHAARALLANGALNLGAKVVRQ